MHAAIRITGNLIELLSGETEGEWIPYIYKGEPSIKHVIESLGIPHTEIGYIVANGVPVYLSYKVRNGDEIEVYPFVLNQSSYFGNLAANGMDGKPRFVLDNHLGKLAVYLRMLGFDSLYHNDYQDNELAEIASKDGRILLTRDRGLLMRKGIVVGCCIRNLDPKLQIVEVLHRYELFNRISPFHRCLRCNSPLRVVAKEDIIDRLQPLTSRYYDEFWTCPDCDRLYWKGSHYERMLNTLDSILKIGETNLYG